MTDDSGDTIRRLIAGDPSAVLAGATGSGDPAVLAAAAVVLLGRARARAATTRDRQLVAITAAHLGGQDDLVDALAREHLADHPDSLFVAWLAGFTRTPGKVLE
ncbi:hypothetical protein [Actinoplanes subglobosus]|uniref:Uncharacterized protein n=1 Tax=Actinoplanes subglobosus TaxID=1547892 RepID=A0ABV8ISI2_9ACTN